MFESLRQSLKDFASGAVPPVQRSAAVAFMRETLVQARVGLADMAAAIQGTGSKVAAEEAELETIRRRKALAMQIGDVETVRVAEQFEQKHAGRIDILARKLALQQEELCLAETEVASMMDELKAVAAGAGIGSGEQSSVREGAQPSPLDAHDLQRDIDGLARQRARQGREEEAEARLAELKRRMQK